jgi:single-strand DNA-binding protein
MLNHIILMGRLTRDPELRHTQSGTPVATFSIAVERDYAPKGAERQTDFFDVVAWQRTAEFVSRYLTKGRLVIVQGRLQTRDWTDQNGGKRRAFEIIADNVNFAITESRRDGQQQGGGQYGNQYSQPSYSQNQYQPQPQQQYGGYQQEAPAPAYEQPQYQAYTSPVSTSDFAELDDDDSDLPF